MGQAVSESKKLLKKARKPKDMRFAVTPEPPRLLSLGEMITGVRFNNNKRRRI